MAESNYIPFSESSSLISTIHSTIHFWRSKHYYSIYQCHTPKTHCYICGTGWSEGYWKHCWCKPNTVPIGDGLGAMILLVVFYSTLKYLKRKIEL